MPVGSVSTISCLDTEKQHGNQISATFSKLKSKKNEFYFSTLLLALVTFTSAYAQEYKIATSVESIVPMGLGRSRMVDPQSVADYKELTSERTDGKTSSQADLIFGDNV